MNDIEKKKNSKICSIIPESVMFDNRLIANEKILLGSIMVLSSKTGYCFASNSYFAKNHNASKRSVSRWISHLNTLNYIGVEIIRNVSQEVEERKIYIRAGPYGQNCLYPMDKNDVYNNIDYNKIDRLYNIIINKESDENCEFDLERFEAILKMFDFEYSKEIVINFTKENVEKVKNIIYALYKLSEYNSLYSLGKLKREKLFFLYEKCLNNKSNIKNFVSYYIACLNNEIVWSVFTGLF